MSFLDDLDFFFFSFLLVSSFEREDGSSFRDRYEEPERIELDELSVEDDDSLDEDLVERDVDIRRDLDSDEEANSLLFVRLCTDDDEDVELAFLRFELRFCLAVLFSELLAELAVGAKSASVEGFLDFF